VGNEAAIGAGSQTKGTKTMSNLPKYYAYAVKDRGHGKKAIWTRIGAAWQTEKGDGIKLQLEALPFAFDGHLVLMPPKAAEAPAGTLESEAA
jgi:hypothetical protein